MSPAIVTRVAEAWNRPAIFRTAADDLIIQVTAWTLAIGALIAVCVVGRLLVGREKSEPPAEP